MSRLRIALGVTIALHRIRGPTHLPHPDPCGLGRAELVDEFSFTPQRPERAPKDEDCGCVRREEAPEEALDCACRAVTASLFGAPAFQRLRARPASTEFFARTKRPPHELDLRREAVGVGESFSRATLALFSLREVRLGAVADKHSGGEVADARLQLVDGCVAFLQFESANLDFVSKVGSLRAGRVGLRQGPIGLLLQPAHQGLLVLAPSLESFEREEEDGAALFAGATLLSSDLLHDAFEHHNGPREDGLGGSKLAPEFGSQDGAAADGREETHFVSGQLRAHVGHGTCPSSIETRRDQDALGRPGRSLGFGSVHRSCGRRLARPGRRATTVSTGSAECGACWRCGWAKGDRGARSEWSSSVSGFLGTEARKGGRREVRVACGVWASDRDGCTCRSVRSPRRPGISVLAQVPPDPLPRRSGRHGCG